MKIISIKTEVNSKNTKIEWFVNGIKVAECKTGWDWFCTVKNGVRSNLRDKIKRTFSTDWNFDGLTALGIKMDNTITRADFNDTYPELNWGYQGSILTKKSLQEKLDKYLA